MPIPTIADWQTNPTAALQAAAALAQQTVNDQQTADAIVSQIVALVLQAAALGVTRQAAWERFSPKT